MTTKSPVSAADRKKLLSQLVVAQREADAAKKAAKLAKLDLRNAKRKFKDAKRAAKKLRKAVKALKTEVAALSATKTVRKPVAKKPALKRSRPAPVPAPVMTAEVAPLPAENPLPVVPAQ